MTQKNTEAIYGILKREAIEGSSVVTVARNVMEGFLLGRFFRYTEENVKIQSHLTEPQGKIKTQITELQLKDPFKIARRATDAARQVVSVEVDGGIGETAPARFYGETVETVSVALETIAPALSGDLDAIHDVMETVETTLGGNYAAKSAIDMALHDRLGKKLGVPLYQLWGLNPHRTPCTSFTIGLDEPEVMAEKTRRAEMYPILKVKLGTPRDYRDNSETSRCHR